MSHLKLFARLNLRPRFALATLTLAACVSCAPTPQGVRKPPRAWMPSAVPAAPQALSQADEAEAKRLWEAARRATDGHDEPGAQAMRDALIRRYPTSEAAAWTYEARAHAAQEAGHLEQAVVQLEHILFQRPQYSHIARIRETYAVLLVRVGRRLDAWALYQAMSRSTQAEAKAHMGQALMQPLMDAGGGANALEIAMDTAMAQSLPEATRNAAHAWAEQMAAGPLPLADAETLVKAHIKDPAYQQMMPQLLLRLAKNAFHVGDTARVGQYLATLAQSYGDTPWAEQGRTFAAQMQARGEVDVGTIGVLLPLSGRYKQFGERSKAAIEMAIGRSPGIKLVVKDTQGDATVAATALEALVFEHHVVAVIGPLFSTEALAAAAKAQELGVPLMALSHKAGLHEVGPYIFRTALTVEAQAQALAKMAFEQLGMTQFALLYPKTRYGIDFTQAFWDEVDRRHGEIRGAEAYEPAQTTFREPVRRLVGRWFLNARSEFRAALTELKGRNLSALRMRAEVAKLDKLSPPLVDFDGLVIPDSGRQLGLIAPAVAFEDVMLAHDARALDRARRASKQSAGRAVTLMGASTWNSPQTLEACEQYCEDGVFVDAYYAGSPEPRVRDFARDFSQRAGSEPNLSEAQAFDTAGLLLGVLKAARPADRSALKDALLAAAPYTGVTGRMQFTAEGELHKELLPLTIKNHQIQLLGRESLGRRR